MSRIYKVKTPAGERLVEANTKSQAINHCVDADYSAEPVSASDMYAMIQAGKTVEKAGAGKPEAGETKQPSASTASAPSAPQPQAPASTAAPATGGATTQAPSQPAFIPPAPATPGQFTPPQSSNPVIAEQQRINPNAAAAAGAPATILPVAPAQIGPVDWEKREQGQ